MRFTGAELGPNSKSKKMIWVTGEKSRELSKLKNELDKSLGFFEREMKDFKPHITIGRVRKKEWKKIHPEPSVDRNFRFSIPVSSVEIFESRFEKGKRVYYKLESFSLR